MTAVLALLAALGDSRTNLRFALIWLVTTWLLGVPLVLAAGGGGFVFFSHHEHVVIPLFGVGGDRDDVAVVEAVGIDHERESEGHGASQRVDRAREGRAQRSQVVRDPGAAQAHVEKAPLDANAAETDPQRLRALADLEEARRAGRISEAEYQRQRAAILQPSGN